MDEENLRNCRGLEILAQGLFFCYQIGVWDACWAFLSVNSFEIRSLPTVELKLWCALIFDPADMFMKQCTCDRW